MIVMLGDHFLSAPCVRGQDDVFQIFTVHLNGKKELSIYFNMTQSLSC